MSNEREIDTFIDDMKKAMAYDLIKIIEVDEKKTYTGQEVINLIHDYIRETTGKH